VAVNLARRNATGWRRLKRRKRAVSRGGISKSAQIEKGDSRLIGESAQGTHDGEARRNLAYPTTATDCSTGPRSAKNKSSACQSTSNVKRNGHFVKERPDCVGRGRAARQENAGRFSIGQF